jgi:squalene-hopene/tetraprenyl-beta-curcumene cyclase
VRPGGWAFQYNNAYYPDLDDTAVVVLALDRARAFPLPSREGANSSGASRENLGEGEFQRAVPLPQSSHASHDRIAPSRKGRGAADTQQAIARGREWVEGLQSKNGGWGAFDADNAYHYLNNIPFADHGALLDPPTEDVTGRCLGMLAQLGEPMDSPRMKAAIDYLERVQLKDGSWFGRWGVNYVYGTWSALAGLNAARVDREHPAMRKAAEWLTAIQNADGGWGESCASYRLDYSGYEPAPSTASQTAWALLGLMAAGEVDHPAVARGISYLQETQGEDGLWSQRHYTGGGFPRVFYLRYHGYPKFFPLWALARYRNLKTSNTHHVSHGL